MIVDPGSMVCVDVATRTRGIAVGFTWRWSTQNPVSIQAGEDQGKITLAGVGWNRLE